MYFKIHEVKNNNGNKMSWKTQKNSNKIPYQKRVIQGKRIKNDEIVRLYIEEFFMKFDEVGRSFSCGR